MILDKIRTPFSISFLGIFEKDKRNLSSLLLSGSKVRPVTKTTPFSNEVLNN